MDQKLQRAFRDFLRISFENAQEYTRHGGHESNMRRAAYALSLARADVWERDQDEVRLVWEDEHESYADVYGDDDQETIKGIESGRYEVRRLVLYGPDDEILDSLGMIVLDTGRSMRDQVRVYEAEMLHNYLATCEDAEEREAREVLAIDRMMAL